MWVGDFDIFFFKTLENPFPQFVLHQVLIAEFGDLAVQRKVKRTFPEPGNEAHHRFRIGQVIRIVLARPAVEAGEKLGFLPGDLHEKVNPYLRPLYDALHDMMNFEKASKLVQRGVIEVAPLAFMRGRTLNDSFVILDEAQNTTSEQMKMFLTRLGFSSKAVITGDVTQIDLPEGKMSGLVEARKVLEGIKGIDFIYFTKKDVIRHPLVQEIIQAYEELEKKGRGTGRL